jgi:hypothetical protein
MTRRTRPLDRALIAVLMAFFLLESLACVQIRPRVVSRKTQVEKQILGELGQLERDLMLAASVRSRGAPGADLSPAHAEALVAMMDRQFRLDDILDLKSRSLVGEARDGTLALQQAKLPRDAEERARVAALAEAENTDRETIMRRILDMNPGLSAADLPEVRRLVFELEVESSPLGTLFEQEDGTFIEKVDAAPDTDSSQAGG